ncbi:hypothetical protein [Streptomyces sp. t39]|uniref:hypothetical protein n=1 Tax=Streptomyces sp. t39 TaxID=1828156 RepID=UPI0011CE59FE|nr:hypothetical protein [Streptomyces sp. t39]TXS52754.1 hypothetical protein EAO77_19500 [Streptomyces sp. t39]
MLHRRVPAAQFIGRKLGDLYETLLGGQDPDALHRLLATVLADICCPPSGGTVSWLTAYDAVWQRPLPHKADWLLDQRGRPAPLPCHLTGPALRRARAAQRIAVRIRREARHLPLGLQG